MTSYIFFPASTSSASPVGTLIGFRVEALTVVVSVVSSARAHALTDELLGRWWTGSPPLERIGSLVSSADEDELEDEPAELRLTLSAAGVPNHPRCKTILYHPPNPQRHHFFSLSALELDVNHPTASPRKGDALEQSEHGTSVTRRREQGRREDGGLREAVRLINAAHTIDRRIRCELDPRSARSRGIGQDQGRSRLKRDATTPGRLVRWMRMGPLLLLRALHTRLPFGGPLLKDLSTTLTQLDVRAEQAPFLPTQLDVLKSDKGADRARYINFYTTLWLIANDVIVGRAFGAVLIDQAGPWGQTCADTIQMLTVDLPCATLRWLDAWPGGLKLNTDLSRFISSSFLYIIELWSSTVLRPALPHLPSILTFTGYSGFLGSTMALSLVSDVLSLLTAHLYVSYLVATVSFRWMRTMLGTLFNVFRGKRTNVLRHRLDAENYTVDQLLLGTVLFTLFAFLAPTVGAYWVFFAATRLLILSAHKALETCLVFLNRFPLFAVMLRIKDPARLPGGVELVPQGGTHLVLKNQPISLAKILF